MIRSSATFSHDTRMAFRNKDNSVPTLSKGMCQVGLLDHVDFSNFFPFWKSTMFVYLINRHNPSNSFCPDIGVNPVNGKTIRLKKCRVLAPNADLTGVKNDGKA